VGLRNPRIDRERRGNQANPFWVVAALGMDDCEHVQRVELPAVLGQHLLERRFGLADIAGLEGPEAPLQRFHDRAGRHLKRA
jgi:hypothetical protein